MPVFFLPKTFWRETLTWPVAMSKRLSFESVDP